MRVVAVISRIVICALGGMSCPAQTIYPNDDVFVEANANDPSATSWTTYNGSVSGSQIVFGLGAANGVSTGRRRSYLEFTLGTTNVTSAKLRIYNYWGPNMGGGGNATVSGTLNLRGSGASAIQITEPASSVVTSWVPPAETDFTTIVSGLAVNPGATGNPVGWYDFDITGWYNARLGQTTTLLLRGSFTGYDFPIFEDREGTAYTNHSANTIPNGGPRILLNDTNQPPPPPSPQLAFPGAEGEGMYVSGGRGGDVYHVTNLNDSGAGSLRFGLDNATAGGRTIVFDVGGMISLSSTLRFSKSKVTIAGQTAPGIGICVRNYGATVSAQNIILRNMRFRAGDANKGPGAFTGDSLSISSSQVIVDHCSASWGIDEGLSSNANGSQDVTVQYCFITENLDQTGLYHDAWDSNFDPGGPSHHSMGSLIKPVSGDGQVSYHHNFWACNYSRNPAVGTYDVPQVFKTDVRNNVIYNNNQNGYRSGGLSSRIDLNYVGNYIIAGPETQSSWLARAFDAKNEDANFYIYQSSNKIDGNRNLVRDGTDTSWGMFAGSYNALASPASMRSVTTQTAEAAYNLVINGAGALAWNRDSVDARQVQQLNSMTGAVIDSQNEVGGYPTIPTASRAAGWDTDNDGLPNYWEIANGLNPNVANNNHVNADGYTDLEHYLNWLADPNAVGTGNSFVDVNLRTFTSSMASNTTYTVSNPTNGTVVLLGDGRTVRFTPLADFFGRASFQFIAADSLAGGAITNTVSLLITPSPPRFVNVTQFTGKVVMSGIGFQSNSSYYLLSSTNAALPANNWTRVATNQFDAAGNFNLTNTPDPNVPQTFYRLQLP